MLPVINQHVRAYARGLGLEQQHGQGRLQFAVLVGGNVLTVNGVPQAELIYYLVLREPERFANPQEFFWKPARFQSSSYSHGILPPPWASALELARNLASMSLSKGSAEN